MSSYPTLASGFVADVAISEGDILQFTSEGRLGKADDINLPFCYAIADRLADEPVDAYLLTAGVHRLKVSGTVSAGDLLKVDPANVGQLTPSAFSTGDQIVGQAAAARTGAGFVDVIVCGISAVIAS